mmetsp:Transcript_83788/g.240901  ORF Transcript_83788/g.240901 Transcript_83788/m.240901 type:complete len:429 (+) Transcript_83788:61-1347(+)|eukprot:CAMPEP_0177182382 /NCGR_PEP_ID=MMETSP0367-20130122/16440_1 /TAXON_ID=447022 ORGANISM="Scrippsiella hangoei-like, Strain SHHI-4" /NCGR_SAMPLE_ID=MMETSP0367 /ASSEMBLY_ACC=CAM_ASM_000362 /LENGTH=428 /DNA_ID=CAMNT_0018629319 /DNA_START=61 /DNA_END=1347 /DNA_ORIENTATION=+
MATTLSIEELSLYGLLSRLELVEKYKGFARPSEEEQAVLDTEAVAKKRVAESLGELVGSGLTSYEKKGAAGFLEGQIKTVEPGSKNADARKAKLAELLSGVRSASSVEEPAHVRRAKTECSRSEKDFEAVHKDYERWEKGKQMLVVDELNKLKRSHDDATKRIEAAKAFLQAQLCRRAENAADLPAALAAARPVVASASSGAARAKASAPGVVRVGGPSVRKAPSAAGYPSAPSTAAVRQAQAVAQMRQEVREPPEPKAPPAALSRPRPQPMRPAEEAPKVVLSYSCTCAAVAEVLAITEKKAVELADSSAEFAAHMTAEQWEQVQKRSVEIEKQRREQQKQAEKRKQDKVLAKISGAAPPLGASAVVSAKAKAKAPPAGFAQVKGKAQPKSVSSKSAALGTLAHGNQWAGMDRDSSDEDEGWTDVKK